MVASLPDDWRTPRPRDEGLPPAAYLGKPHVGQLAHASDVKAVAGYVANALRTDGVVELLAAGPPSVNRAVKAVCLARNYLEDDGVDLVVSAFVPMLMLVVWDW